MNSQRTCGDVHAVHISMEKILYIILHFFFWFRRDPRFKDHLQQQAEQQLLNQNPEIAENEELYEQEKKRIKTQMSSMGCKYLTSTVPTF